MKVLSPWCVIDRDHKQKPVNNRRFWRWLFRIFDGLSLRELFELFVWWLLYGGFGRCESIGSENLDDFVMYWCDRRSTFNGFRRNANICLFASLFYRKDLRSSNEEKLRVKLAKYKWKNRFIKNENKCHHVTIWSYESWKVLNLFIHIRPFP